MEQQDPATHFARDPQDVEREMQERNEAIQQAVDMTAQRIAQKIQAHFQPVKSEDR
jgi:acetate kinase